MKTKVFLLTCILSFLWTSPVYAMDVMVEEFFPNPVGEDTTTEWIELYNSSSMDVNLDGWTITDLIGSSHTFTFHNVIVTAHHYLVLHQSETGITLNNDKEQVKLNDSSGNEQITDFYSPVHEGMSFAMVNNQWQETSPTEGTASIFPPSPSPAPTSSPSMQPSPTPSPTPSSTPTLMQSFLLNEIHACGSMPEWVELYNPNSETLSMKGWSLHDASDHIKTLDDVVLPSRGYAAKEWNDYYLNNDNETIALWYQSQKIDSFSYTRCMPESSWARKQDGNWEETIAQTEGSENTFLGSVQFSLPSPSPFLSDQLIQPFQDDMISHHTPSMRSSTFIEEGVMPDLHYDHELEQGGITSTISAKLKILGASSPTEVNKRKQSWYVLCAGLTFIVGSMFHFFRWYNKLL